MTKNQAGASPRRRRGARGAAPHATLARIRCSIQVGRFVTRATPLTSQGEVVLQGAASQSARATRSWCGPSPNPPLAWTCLQGLRGGPYLAHRSLSFSDEIGLTEG